MNRLLSTYFILSALTVSLANAQETQDSPTFANDFDIRVNPELDNVMCDSMPQFAPGDYSAFPFIDTAGNRIDMNGADWSRLRQRLSEGMLLPGMPFSIVHIGDSHIQADGATGITRKMFQERYGNAGRGLVIPLKMAGTNEPRDYKITSISKGWQTARLMKTPWMSEMQFTGVSITPGTHTFNLSVGLLTRTLEINPFNTIRLFHSGSPLTVKAVESRGDMMRFSTSIGSGYTDIYLDKPVTDVTLDMSCTGGKAHIGGLALYNGQPGIVYSTIGNNGAAYMSYNSIGSIGAGIRPLQPDLVVISLGANEAFGKVTDSQFRQSINAFVEDIRQENPNAGILLVTPMECQRRTSSRTGKGRKRRRTTTYSVNTDIKRLRDVIIQYGKDNHIPVYDLYGVAGGAGASGKWIDNSLMGRDRIHNTWEGYDLQGRLFYDALSECLENMPPPPLPLPIVPEGQDTGQIHSQKPL